MKEPIFMRGSRGISDDELKMYRDLLLSEDTKIINIYELNAKSLRLSKGITLHNFDEANYTYDIYYNGYATKAQLRYIYSSITEYNSGKSVQATVYVDESIPVVHFKDGEIGDEKAYYKLADDVLLCYSDDAKSYNFTFMKNSSTFLVKCAATGTICIEQYATPLILDMRKYDKKPLTYEINQSYKYNRWCDGYTLRGKGSEVLTWVVYGDGTYDKEEINTLQLKGVNGDYDVVLLECLNPNEGDSSVYKWEHITYSYSEECTPFAAVVPSTSTSGFIARTGRSKMLQYRSNEAIMLDKVFTVANYVTGAYYSIPMANDVNVRVYVNGVINITPAGMGSKIEISVNNQGSLVIQDTRSTVYLLHWVGDPIINVMKYNRNNYQIKQIGETAWSIVF